MTDKKPCGKCQDCKCKKPCDYIPYDEELYVEIDCGPFAPYNQYTLADR